jgi:hypothetical protein
MSRARASALAVTALLLCAPCAHGAEPKREVPDYDGRGPKPTTAGDVLLWFPRLLASPIYFTTEYVLRRPIGAFLTWAERARALQSFYDFFAFGPEHKAGFAPIAFLDFGFNPAFGVYLFWDDALTKGNDLSFHGTTWGSDWLAGVWTDRVHLDPHTTFTFNTAAVRRPDHVFFGVGPSSLYSNLGRYGESSVDVTGTFDLKPTRVVTVQARGGVRSADFFPGYYGGDPSIEAVARSSRAYPLPDGYARGYTSVYEHVSVAIDTRRPQPENGSGIRIEADAENAGDLRAGSGWVRYGGAIGAFWDVTGTRRVLSLSLAAAFADPLGRNPIPFTELVAVGGDGPMRGYYPGRLLGRSSAVLTARYRWPIWMWLDGSIQAAIGNVFDAHLEGFAPGLLRFSGAIGLESSFSPTSSIEVLVGIGTETFDHQGGPTINSARFVVGSSRGF